MKLYAVYKDIYDEYDCVGIFDSCDKAEECVMQHWKEWNSQCCIFTIMLNEYDEGGLGYQRGSVISWRIEYNNDKKKRLYLVDKSITV